MRITNFMLPTAEECAMFYPTVRANANRHLVAADTLASIGDYGNAIAHRILGSEEMVKALILFLEGKGMDLRSIEAIKPLFRYHVPRHKLFKTLFSALHTLYSISAATKLSYGKALATLFRGGLESYYNSKWWGNAERYKQNAFYVDHQGSFIDPGKLTKEQYQTAYTYTRTVNERMSDVITYVSKMDEQELSWFKESFHIAEFPELLEKKNKKIDFMDQLEEINELSLGDIVVRSSVQVFVADKAVLKPIAFGTGFMLHHRERLFFVSVRHVTDYDQYHTYLETNRQGTEEGTPIRPQGGFCYFDLYKVADAKDIKEFEDLFKEGEMLDITFSEMKGEIGLLQPEIDFGSFKVNGGTKIVIDSSSIAEPDKNKYYALFGKIKHDYHGKILHAVNAFKGDLKFHRTKNNFHMFLAPNIIINKDEYQGCSGAPIFDSDGYLTAVVCQIVTNTKIVMGFSIQECISLLNIAIDTNLIDEKN